MSDIDEAEAAGKDVDMEDATEDAEVSYIEPQWWPGFRLFLCSMYMSNTRTH